MRAHKTTQYRLETELSGYKTNLIKESIRMGHHELADFFYDRGDLQVPVHQTSWCVVMLEVWHMSCGDVKCGDWIRACMCAYAVGLQELCAHEGLLHHAQAHH